MKMQRRKRKKTDSSLLKRRSVSEKRAGTFYETSRRFFSCNTVRTASDPARDGDRRGRNLRNPSADGFPSLRTGSDDR